MDTVLVQIEATPAKGVVVEGECEPLTFIVDLSLNDSDATAKHDVKQAEGPPLVLTAADQISECKPSEAAPDDTSPLTVQIGHSETDDRENSITTPTDVECPPGLLEPKLSEPSDTVLLPECKGILPASHLEDESPAIPADISSPNPTVPAEDPSLYSLDGVPPLESFIPDSLLPDDLLIHDPDNITGTGVHGYVASGSPSSPVRYVRLYPKSSRDLPDAANAYVGRNPSDSACIAHLYLKERNRLGRGHHSIVYRAPLELRLDPHSPHSRRVSVAVKAAGQTCGAHRMLNQEADIYNAFPRHLMEDVPLPSPSPCPPRCSNVNKESVTSVMEVEQAGPQDTPLQDEAHPAHVSAGGMSCSEPGSAHKEPADYKLDIAPGTQVNGGEDECTPDVPTSSERASVIPAVVPKFFGYYVPVEADGTLCRRAHRHCDEDMRCYVTWPTGILLLEECGEELASPYHWSWSQRMDCFRLFSRLGDAGFVQASPYTRNMLVQPGPLSVPPAKRSLKEPSFRIIDFGRGDSLSLLLQSGSTHVRQFDEWVSDDRERAERALRL
ncbi:hypothetical protein C8Q78DRAFT_729494 [Trametes maxima]|nr:hypothetical protein C8Q78DRAFT_729494 [Trametes maxima]